MTEEEFQEQIAEVKAENERLRQQLSDVDLPEDELYYIDDDDDRPLFEPTDEELDEEFPPLTSEEMEGLDAMINMDADKAAHLLARMQRAIDRNNQATSELQEQAAAAERSTADAEAASRQRGGAVFEAKAEKLALAFAAAGGGDKSLGLARAMLIEHSELLDKEPAPAHVINFCRAWLSEEA